MLVDSHCHLNFPEFAADLPGVMNRAVLNDVGVMQTICTKLSEFPEVLAVAEQFSNVWASVGVHPNHVDEAPMVEEEALLVLTQHPKVIGIGETGLDYYRDHAAKEHQQESFRRHIRVARRAGIPVIVHTRDADEDTIRVMREEMEIAQFTGLLHCFTGTTRLAQAAMEMGLYISISGIVTFKNAVALQELVKSLPLQRLLVETDAPYLAPVPYRGKTNEPAFTRHTAEYIAELKEVSYDSIAEATTRNFFTLFSKAK